MKFGLTQDQYDFIKGVVALPLQAKGAAVYCYGSRARGDHRPFSDLDLMVESKSPKELGLEAIRDELRDSSFPFKVDLVHLSEFAESYKPSYKKDRVPF
jgi:predicted nucleotidyltransferase